MAHKEDRGEGSNYCICSTYELGCFQTSSIAAFLGCTSALGFCILLVCHVHTRTYQFCHDMWEENLYQIQQSFVKFLHDAN